MGVTLAQLVKASVGQTDVWASCAVELTSGLELITSFWLLRFYFSSNFYVSYIIEKLGICSFQRYATLKNLSSRKRAVIS